jgi:hypothetical protein
MSVFARTNPPTMMVGSSIPSRSTISSSTAGAAVAVRTKPDFRANGVASSALLNTEGKAALAFGDPAAVSRLGTSTEWRRARRWGARSSFGYPRRCSARLHLRSRFTRGQEPVKIVVQRSA